MYSMCVCLCFQEERFYDCNDLSDDDLDVSNMYHKNIDSFVVVSYINIAEVYRFLLVGWPLF